MLFSVIIPLYNKAPYVAKAIQSVLSQAVTDYELIIVDDGSKDNSAEIAAKAIENQPNCRLIRQNNAGVSTARNNGVAVSQGDYLCFLDADDWWDSHFLEEMAKLIEEFPEAGIYGTNYTIVNETKHKTRVSPIGLEPGFGKGYINYCQLYANSNTAAMPLWTGAVSIPRGIYEEMGGFPKDIKMGEDFILWIHIALKYKVVFLNKPLAYYNQDVDVANRGIGRLYKPEEHMLWNLMDLEQLERTNVEYKRMVDSLRVTSLMPYLLSDIWRVAAEKELEKVDWTLQDSKIVKKFQRPICWLRIKYVISKIGIRLKLYMTKVTVLWEKVLL